MLVGIARMAAEAVPLEQKRRVEYFRMEARSLLNRCSSGHMPFQWTVNPYRGCEFGCRYCYARSTHEFLELRDPEDFERQIFAKEFPAGAFREELRRVGAGESIAIGTATDPYQPAERRYGFTREILRVFSRLRGFALSITTKSDLIGRDAELIGEIAAANSVVVNMTVTTMRAALARELEPMAPRPDLRMVAVCKLAAAGVNTGVFASPVMPFLNDSVESIMTVARAAREAGAVRFGGHPLFLQPVPRGVFLEFVRERYPELLGRYRRLFARGAYMDAATVEHQKVLLRRAAVTFGFPNAGPPAQVDPQMELFG
jgi:DNA repair photolyase